MPKMSPSKRRQMEGPIRHIWAYLRDEGVSEEAKERAVDKLEALLTKYDQAGGDSARYWSSLSGGGDSDQGGNRTEAKGGLPDVAKAPTETEEATD